MKRRDFVKAAGLAMALPLGGAAVTSAAGGGREFYELRKYSSVNRSRSSVLNDFLREAAVPAWNRIGIGPVGVFNVLHGPNQPTVYVLLPHKSMESLVTAYEKLDQDAAYKRTGDSFLKAPISEPGYLRLESSLLQAFKELPKIGIAESVAGVKTRIFELRIYESHSTAAGKKKVEMFNEGGEIAIFKKTGLNPVFFGETLIGPRMPNLTYMLAFENMAHRDKQWSVFRDDPDWLRISKMAEYADTVSNITDLILRPAAYSQI